MMNNRVEVREFIPTKATEADFVALHQYENQMRAERLPGEPLRTLELVKSDLLSTPSFVQLRMWLAWDVVETAVIGQSVFAYLDTEENRHLGQVAIGVVPTRRQQGIARRLLALIAAVAEANDRRLLIGNTNGRVPAGEQFMERLGGQRGLVTHQNQLILANLDHALLQRWQDEAPTDRFMLGFWQGAYPEDQLDNIVALHEVMNQQPRDDLDVEDMRLTGEHLRQIEANLAAQGIERWTLYVQETATGRLAGYTEVAILPNRDDLVSQGDTGVFPAYRGQGLGRWLKAAMVAKLRAERPSAKFIRTTNADSNAAMLKINREIGFRPHMSQTIWQIETAKVKEYLEGRR